MRFLVFQHVDVEHPGIFRDFWHDQGVAWVPVELDAGEPIPPLEDYDALIVMGGPMDVWQHQEHPWLIPERAAIRRFVAELGRPFLGVCLGHQLLAEALGGAVGPSRRPEVGITPVRLTEAGARDPLFAGLPSPLETFQWHSAEVNRLPPGAVLLAENEACAVQAFRIGDHAFGVQFHVEITASTVADWQRIPAYSASLAAALGPEGSQRLAPDTLARLPSFNATARRINDNFLSVLSKTKLALAT